MDLTDSPLLPSLLLRTEILPSDDSWLHIRNKMLSYLYGGV